ncbi:MAG TPA: ABC transporter permease [Longimicrobiales bacterium]|nr:ABC transporter permease [Longimicrobiales bacterium]
MVVDPSETVREGPIVREAGVEAAAGAAIRQSSLWRDAWRRYIRNRGAVLAASVFIAVVLYCFIVPGFGLPFTDARVPGVWTATQGIDPNDVDFRSAYQTPSLAHPLGTDQFGRDLFARTALGGQVSITIGFGATVAILLIGVAYGAISGFAGGMLDNGMMRFLDALYGLPYLPFAILTLAIVGTVNTLTMVLALSIASWFTAARIVRGQIITLKQNDYVRAARAVGARWNRILLRHLLPNTLGVLIIAIFLELPGVILGEAFLSFIGLGINPPDASWGSMAQDGYAAYRVHPHIILIPSVAIATLVLCANFVADGLRDALDPRTKET